MGVVARVTLEGLRRRFWWLGATRNHSYIVGLENDRVTIDITQYTWNRHTQHYEESVERQLRELGLSVAWQRRWSEVLRKQLVEARARAEAAGARFDEVAFVACRQDEETRRVEREEGEG
jgi:hypothetical protein